MTATFVVVPQWQGSDSARAMRLVEGAEAIRGDLPSAATIAIPVPLEAGESQGSGIARFSSIQLVRDRLARALSTVDGVAITIGGDCGVELAAVSHVADQGDLAVVWFDAHADLNTPESSESNAFGGMVLRTLLGDGAPGLVPAWPLDPARVVIVGARELDSPEESYVAAAGIRLFEPEASTADAVVKAVADTGATRLYIHLDLDVFDPVEFAGLDSPVPFGLGVGAVIEIIRALTSKFDLVGAGIAQFAPASVAQATDDLPTILRIIAAMTA
jgi:arginase